MASAPVLEYYDVKFLLQNGEIKIYQNIYNDALFQVIYFIKKTFYYKRIN
jgi:hypothetical protein